MYIFKRWRSRALITTARATLTRSIVGGCRGDPALGDYIPTRGADASKLAGLGGVYNTVNLHLYHYSGNNPVKYIDPDGKVVFVPAAIVWGINTILLSYGIGASRKDEYGFALRHPIISADRCKWVSILRKIMKKQFILLLILIALFLLVCFLVCFTCLRPANQKLHTIWIGKEKKLTDIYRYKCEKIVFIEGKNKKDKIKVFCDSVEIKEWCENHDVLMLFIDKDRHAIVYPLYTYFDDLEGEPFYDGIWFEVPFEKELPKDYVFVKRLTKNSFGIKVK